MNISTLAVEKPVSTIVGVLLIVLFGAVAIFNLPIQMKPNVDKPVLKIETSYPGAAPTEVEEQITDRLEEKLNAVEGLLKMTSTSSQSLSSISLDFEWGSDQDSRFVDVLQKINQVEDLPEESDPPIISAVSAAQEERIMWITIRSDTLNVQEMTHFAENEIKDSLERVEGVGDILVFGRLKREITISLDPEEMVGRGITLETVRGALLRENRNVRGGYLDEGKTRFNIRTIGQFQTVEEINKMILSRSEEGTIYLEDIGQAIDGFERVESVVRGDGEPMIAVGISKKVGSNVVEITEKLEEQVKKLNTRFAKFLYKGRAADMELYIAYREARYIWQSLEFVTINLLTGACLAAIVLIFFLRSLRSTFIVAIIIPICFISIFIFLQGLGRSINIISLAGIAFAVGMTVDNAIVVIENIYRYMEMGKNRLEASIEGVQEVWGAVLASTLTTMAVFLPIIYVKEEAGELFKDIAIAISCSVAVSMILAITVTPMLASRLLHYSKDKNSWSDWLIDKILWIPSQIGKGITWCFVALSKLVTGIYLRRVRFLSALLVIVLLSGLSVAVIYYLMPAREYLPNGNRNMLIIIHKPHVGTNIAKTSEISLSMEKKVLPLLFDNNKEFSEDNRLIDHMFAVVSGRFNIIGVIIKEKYANVLTSELPMKINPRTQSPFRSAMDYYSFLITSKVFGTAGTEFAIAVKPSLFGGQGKTFEIDVRGPKIDRLDEIAKEIEAKMKGQQKDLGLSLIHI